MIHISKNKIPKELFEIPVVLFGAGSTGKTISKLLQSFSLNINYFVDDDDSKIGQNEKINNIEIISFEKFQNLCKQLEHVAVVMTSIYGKAIIERLQRIKQVDVYEMYDWYCDVVNHNNCIAGIDDTKEIAKFKNQMEVLKTKWADNESYDVYNGLYAYINSKNSSYINKICTEKEQYFIPEVIAAIHTSLTIIDGGAYEGELLRSINKFDLEIDSWYCFEADINNFEKLSFRAKKNGLSQKQICINKGLWKDEETLYFEKKGSASKIVDYKTMDCIETISIDSYFNNIHFNYIKMDIEGAEFPALYGGMYKIQKERPILAISIYHSLEDFYRIPLYLMENLHNYKFYVRHHALIFCETVLYAIPNEL